MTAEASCLLFKWKVYIFNHFTRVELLALLEPCQASSPDIGKARLHLFKCNFQTVLCRVLAAVLNSAKTSPSERDTHCQQSLLSEITWTPIFSVTFIKMVDCHYSSTQSSTRIPLYQLLPRNGEMEGTTACLPKPAKTTLILIRFITLWNTQLPISDNESLYPLSLWLCTENSMRQSFTLTFGSRFGLASA